mmetsp:Transcript_6028/g.9989  ORF Transcript_6028/g.9989 Transcript_6028/m.9989 type:complete len:251 (-) Transcript_6028:36-788(-)
MPQPGASEVQAKLRARYGNKAGSTRTGGGKNAMRRKKFRPKKSTNEFEKRLQSNLKKLSCNTIPGIEEVNLFKSDGTVIHFVSPKVDAEVASNTFIVSGNYTQNKIEELLPDILPQIGSDHLTQLKTYAEKFEALKPSNDDDNDASNAALAGADDGDVPMLIDEDLNFEQIAQSDEKKEDKEEEPQQEQDKETETEKEKDAEQPPAQEQAAEQEPAATESKPEAAAEPVAEAPAEPQSAPKADDAKDTEQ